MGKQKTAAENMSRNDVITMLSEELGTSKNKTTDAVVKLFDAISATVAAGGKVQINGFGSFEQRTRASRTGRNPQTGESITINEKVVPAFKPGKKFKDTVAAAK